MTKLHYWECGLMCKRNGMPKDYGVVNWPYNTYIIYAKKNVGHQSQQYVERSLDSVVVKEKYVLIYQGY